MRGAGKDQPRILSRIPGRWRVHLPDEEVEQKDLIEARLRQVPGVEDAEANPLTGNVLIRFDPRTTDPEALLAVLQSRANPEAKGKAGGLSPLLRVGVRGLLGHAVVDACWFGAGFLGARLGVPLAAGLGPLHVLMDIAVWGMALASANEKPPTSA